MNLIGLLPEFVKRFFLSRYFGSLVRHGMTALGGFLIANNISDPETVGIFVETGTEVLIGLATFIAGIALSFAEKVERKSKQVEALNEQEREE